jgi:hypothetical protein
MFANTGFYNKLVFGAGPFPESSLRRPPDHKRAARGTAALQVNTGHGNFDRDLEGVRSVGAAKLVSTTAGDGCEGPQPEK